MSKKVEIQKGEMKMNCKTYKNCSHSEKVSEANENHRILKSNQDLHLHQPKTGRGR